MKKSATLYLERWSIPYRSVGLSRTGALVYPVPERWSIPYRSVGLSRTRASVYPVPERWSIPYRSVGLSRTGALVYPVPERWSIPYRSGRGSRRCADLPRPPLQMDLQWFADPEDEGRTEEATEERIRKAREEEGRVAKSQELISALVLLLPTLALLILAPSMLKTCVEMLRFYLLRAVELDPTKDRLIPATALLYFAQLALPLIIVGMIAGIFANLMQVGVLFTTKPLTPKFDRILPKFGKYFGRIFSTEGIFNLLKSIVKMAIIGGVAFFVIRSKIDLLINLQTASLWTGISTVASLAIRMLFISAMLLLALSIPDYLFQRHQYMESLKMTKQEVKEERKQYEGDPLVKGRLRARMRELLSQNMAVNVPKADVVITNPTHFAVALEYEQTRGAPQITAKGEDEMAFLIRRLARDSGVPIVENKPLARALYAETKVGDLVPAKYWQVVAEVLARVMKINEDRRKRP